MTHRKNVKRIDPRYFLHETVNRNDDGSVLEEAADQIGPWQDRGPTGTVTMPAVTAPDPEDEDEGSSSMHGVEADDIAAVIEYAVQKGLKDGMRPEEAEQIFADIQGEKTYADRDVQAAYEDWERYDLGEVDPDAMEL
jgi:hypothetical protein